MSKKRIFFILIVLIFISGGFVLGDTSTNNNFFSSSNAKKAENISSIDMTPDISFIHPKKDERLDGEEKVAIKIKEAISVDFYVNREGSLVNVYLGKGISQGSQQWVYSWNTLNTPNGDYQFFVKVTNDYGNYESQRIGVIVENVAEKSDRLKERERELENINNQLQKREADTEEIINLATEEIIKEISDSTKLASEENSDIELEEQEKIEGEIEEAGTTIEAGIDDIAESIQEENELEEEITKNTEKKNKIEKEIKEKQKELKGFEDIGLPGIKDEKVETIKREKRVMIENQEKTKEEIQNKIEEKQKRLSEVKIQKETKKQEIIESAVKPLEAIKERIENSERISNMQTNVMEKIKEKILTLETKVSTVEKSKIELNKQILQDSDSDGLPDSFEIEIGSNPFNPDSDGDGYLDGEEVVAGFDPLTFSKEDKIVYQDPRRVEPKREGIFIVETARTRISENTNNQILRIEGRGLPNTFLTLYIYSSLPTVVVTRTDADGRWVYELDKTIDSGEHEIYVVLTNNQGEITARSEAFNFIKSGANILQLIPEVWAKESGKGMEEVASPYEILQRSFVVLTLAIIVLAIGVALVLVGVLNKRKSDAILFPLKKKKVKKTAKTVKKSKK